MRSGSGDERVNDRNPRSLLGLFLIICRVGVVSVVAFVVPLYFHGHTKRVLERADNYVSDAFFIARDYTFVVRRHVVIIKEDDRTVDALGEGLALRRFHAAVLGYLEGIRLVKVIVFDGDFRGESDHDKALAKAIKASKKPIVAGVRSNARELKQALARTGYIGGFIRNPDGIERHVRIAEGGSGQHCSPSLALEAMAAFYNVDSRTQLECGDGRLFLRPRWDLPVDQEYRMAINFSGPPGSIPSVSYVDVVRKGSKALEPLFNDNREKVVLIGVESTDYQKDLHHTSVGVMSGVELQANVINTFVHERFLKRPPWIGVVLFSLCVSVLITLCVSACRTHRQLLLLVILFIVTFVIAVYLAFSASVLTGNTFDVWNR